ncbi:putative DNA primase [Pectobacterium phage MA11]|uniref:DNA primase n=1 Tax=Pectobacterium phage MA11 TaxID=2662283 RepID=UPI0012A797C9|nr:DNA primase [Pectobacterium phage MA11]QGF21057.1 putative DNA primase [Pectobacterium phage MA11]
MDDNLHKTKLAEVWPELLENGYNFLPLKFKTKRPPFDEWTEYKADSKLAKRWEKEFKNGGAGLNTTYTPAVDIDVYDDAMASALQELVEFDYGITPVRFGQAPKRLMLFRTDEPFTKMSSGTWMSPSGHASKIEILGEGQQLVAFGIHPDTDEPYWWVDGKDPTNTDISELPMLTAEDGRAICDAFDVMAEEAGWKPKLKAKKSRKVAASIGEDDAFGLSDADLVRKWDGSDDELERLVMLIPGYEDYQTWIEMIAALQISVENQELAYDVALKWSAQAFNFDMDSFEDKWEKGFHHDGDSLITLATFIKQAREIEKEQAALVAEEIIPLFEQANSKKEWMEAADRFKREAIFGVARNDVRAVAIEAFKRIFNRPLDKAEAKSYLDYRPNADDLPEWLKPWVLDQVAGSFVNRNNAIEVLPGAFNMANQRFVSSDKEGGSLPVDLATKIFPVPVVDGQRYDPLHHGDLPNNEWKRHWKLPGVDLFKDELGRTFLNTFNPDTLAKMPDDFSKQELKAINTLKDFFFVQFPDDKERRYVLDWLAWVIANPGRRVDYALVIRGTQGSGKSIIASMLKCLLGHTNVDVVNNKIFQGKFTGWTEGGLVKVLEEVSVPRHKYDVINDLKDKITNPYIPCERKGVDSFEIRNTASYIAFTNDPAALPIDNEDRRWLIVESYFTNTDVLNAFKRQDPNFFRRMDAAFRRYPGALRKWFSEWEFSESFSHDAGQAPRDTAARDYMIDYAVDDITRSIKEATYSGTVRGVSNALIFLPDLKKFIVDAIPEREIGRTSAINRRLSDLGYKKVGTKSWSRVRVDGEEGYVYALDPRKWMKEDGNPDPEKVRNHFAEHNKNEEVAFDDVDDDL